MDLTLAICMYNAERFLEETLESVVAQTRQDFHLLIIDDASTDDSSQLVERFFQNNPRQYELIRLPNNQGIGYCRHFAERHAKTRYMMFLDADDILLPQAIERMWSMISCDKDLMAVGCYLDYIDAKGKKLGGGLYLGLKTKEEFIEKASKGKLIFMQPTAIYDREAALSVGGYDIDSFNTDDGIRWQDYCEDLDLWTRMSDLYIYGRAIVVIPEVLALYRKAGGMSSSTFRMNVKMRYVKNNVKLRRSHKPEVKFGAFYSGLTASEISKLKHDAKVADSLRNAAFFFKNHDYLGAVRNGLWVLFNNPRYMIDKIKHNFVKRR